VELGYLMTQSMVAITQADCTGCDLCISHCPFEALLPLSFTPQNLRKRPVVVVESRCVGCLSCIGSCPTDALFEISLPPSANESPLRESTMVLEVLEIPRWSKGGVGVA
jgi:ferredoxin